MPFWTKKALRNLNAILEHIALDDIATAERIALSIRTAANRLDQYPQMGRVSSVDGARELVFPNLPYVLVYRVNGRRIQILRFLHTRQQWP